MRTQLAAAIAAVVGGLTAHAATAAPLPTMPTAEPQGHVQLVQYYGYDRGYGYGEGRREEWRRRRWMEERRRREEWRRERWRQERWRRDRYGY